MQYCRIKNDRIVMGPVTLPEHWVDNATSQPYELSEMNNVELKKLGWLPVIESDVVTRDPYDTVEMHEFTIEDGYVQETIVLRDLVLEEVVMQKLRLLSLHIDEKLEGAFPFNGHLWVGNSTSRQNILGITTAIANSIPLPQDFTWHTADGTALPMDAQAMLGLGATMMGWVNTTYGVGYFHQSQIQALTSIDQIIDYDFSTGWPT